MPDTFEGPTYRVPAGEEVSHSRIKAGAITKVGITVKNLETTMADYQRILGIGPWEVIEAASPTLGDALYDGQPASHAMRIGRAMAGPILLELVQPVTGDNFFLDFLCEHGEGVSHLGSEVADVSEITKTMAEAGFATLQSGRLNDGAFALFDTRLPLKTAWEAYHP